MSDEQLDLELDHIFESGANQERIKTLIGKLQTYVVLIENVLFPVAYSGNDLEKAGAIADSLTQVNCFVQTWANGECTETKVYALGVKQLEYPF